MCVGFISVLYFFCRGCSQSRYKLKVMPMNFLVCDAHLHKTSSHPPRFRRHPNIFRLNLCSINRLRLHVSISNSLIFFAQVDDEDIFSLLSLFLSSTNHIYSLSLIFFIQRTHTHKIHTYTLVRDVRDAILARQIFRFAFFAILSQHPTMSQSHQCIACCFGWWLMITSDTSGDSQHSF